MSASGPHRTELTRDPPSVPADRSLHKAVDLQPLADQLMHIAERLREGDGLNGHSRNRAARPQRSRRELGEIARRAYETRRRRAMIFGTPELFGEPAWDILLDLYIALAEGKDVSVSSACIGSAAPPTTGLRWLGILAEHGLVIREQDAEDQRRVLVRLTDRGAKAMDEFFAKMSEP